MPFLKNISGTIRSIFDDGLDEVLIFAIVFIFILLSGRESDGSNKYEDDRGAGGILPLIIIAAFLLLFSAFTAAPDS